MHYITIPALEIGTASSGNRGHAGRKGKVGGSSKSKLSSAAGVVSVEYDAAYTLAESAGRIQRAFEKIPEKERLKSACKKIIVYDNPEDLQQRVKDDGFDELIEGDETVFGMFDFATGTAYVSIYDLREHENSLRTFYHEIGHSIVGGDEDAATAWAAAYGNHKYGQE